MILKSDIEILYCAFCYKAYLFFVKNDIAVNIYDNRDEFSDSHKNININNKNELSKGKNPFQKAVKGDENNENSITEEELEINTKTDKMNNRNYNGNESDHNTNENVV